MVQDHYAKARLPRPLGEGPGGTLWAFETATDIQAAPMTVIRSCSQPAWRTHERRRRPTNPARPAIRSALPVSMAGRLERRRCPAAATRRDWLILLPLVAVVTALVFLVIVEGGSRLVWPESKDDVCAYNPLRPKANCVSHDKAAEGRGWKPASTACGYRSTGPCGPVSSGTARLAVIGLIHQLGLSGSFRRCLVGAGGKTNHRQVRTPYRMSRV